MNENKILEYHEKIQSLKTKRERKIGERDNVFKQLEEQGFDSIKAAEDELDKLEDTITAKEDEFAKGMKNFEDKYGDKL